MRVHDSRPPFAGLANLSEAQLPHHPPPAICWTKPNCAATVRSCWACSSAPAAASCWRRRLFNFNVYPVLAPYLAGTEASGLYESRLGREELPEKENHVFCAAYRTDEFEELLQYADHIVFNSPSQLAKFDPAAKAAGKSIGLRINPECSTQEGHEIYDLRTRQPSGHHPCSVGRRRGSAPGLPALLDGLHFHTLCEQDADALAVTLAAVEKKFTQTCCPE